MASRAGAVRLDQSGGLYARLARNDGPVAVGLCHEGDLAGLEGLIEKLMDALRTEGCRLVSARDDSPRLVINATSVDAPRIFRRSSQAIFVVSVVAGPTAPDPLKGYYPYLIRTLSNALIYVTRDQGLEEAHLITPERGCVRIDGPTRDDLCRQLARRLLPLASSHLIIDNEFDPDLPEALRRGDRHTAAFYEVGQRLDRLNLLPAPFDLESLLAPSDLRHLQRLYKLGGLSHGNMSERLDHERFWMSASGVNKSAMKEIGRDILLVKGFSPERRSIQLSVPPDVTPRRVSVDAIEHWMIYAEHPTVGAILHVHAWMEGVPSTEVAYPCGTFELAAEVAQFVREAPDPTRCVVGLKNHGLTITGTSLREIMDRVESRLLPRIPME